MHGMRFRPGELTTSTSDGSPSAVPRPDVPVGALVALNDLFAGAARP